MKSVEIYQFIETHRTQYPVKKMADTLGVSRSAFYKPKSTRENHNDLTDMIKQLFEASNQEYGAKRIHLALQALCIETSFYRVKQLMKAHHLIPKARRKYKVTTKQSKKPHYVAPNLLKQNFTVYVPNQVWVSDITYVLTNEGWLYVATVLDLFSRKIVGLAMSQRLKTDLVLRAVTQAVQRRKPPKGLILHSDRGCQYTSKAYRKLTSKYGIELSMSSTGNCFDNAVAESFFHTLKVNLIHGEKYQTRNQATRAIFEYVEIFYNKRRMHSSLNYLTPEQFENIWSQNQKSIRGTCVY